MPTLTWDEVTKIAIKTCTRGGKVFEYKANSFEGACKMAGRDFPPNGRTTDGLGSLCRTCHFANQRLRTTMRRGRRYEQSYAKITCNERDLIYKRQRGRCAIFGMEAAYLDLVPDHNHETGLLRGLVTQHANKRLSLLESPTQRKLMFKYLFDRDIGLLMEVHADLMSVLLSHVKRKI